MSISPGALTVAVESGNLAEVQRVGNAMSHEGWTVNWLHHARTANNKGKLAIRNYLTRKAAENKASAAAMKFGGGSKRRRSTKRVVRRRSRR